MSNAIPDLWQLKEDASRLYQIYLAQLQGHHQHERVIKACRQIRRFAKRGPGSEAGLFTFHFEIDSLCELKDYKTAWRQLRVNEKLAYGKQINIASQQWTDQDQMQLRYSYAPLLYFLGRYREGCQLLEIWMDSWFAGQTVHSYDLLLDVCNGEPEPSHKCRVTLAHFYTHLNKDLQSWRHWEAFVSGLHPRLFRLTGVHRDDLLSDATHLAMFVNKLVDIRDARVTSGIGGSQSDVIGSSTKVVKRQEELLQRVNDFHERNRSARKKIDQKLRELFPEVAEFLI